MIRRGLEPLTLGVQSSRKGRGTIHTVVDNEGNGYVVSLGIGSLPTQYNLIVDTGSFNTWVGAGKKYQKTKTSIETGDSVVNPPLLDQALISLNAFIQEVNYGSGKEFIDQVTISSSNSIPGQSISLASSSIGFNDVDGILGIGPEDVTIDTFFNSATKTVLMVTDNLFSDKIVPSNVIGISFEPPNPQDDPQYNGGFNDSKFSEPMTYFPITTTIPASNYWGVDQSIRYGESNLIIDRMAGIVDTGTTLILLATDSYNKYVAATGAKVDMITIPNAQIWPRFLNTEIGGTNENVYFVNDIGSTSGQGLHFVNGYAFLFTTLPTSK